MVVAKAVTDGKTVQLSAAEWNAVTDSIETLESAVRDYLREWDNPVPDYALRLRLRDKLVDLVGK